MATETAGEGLETQTSAGRAAAIGSCVLCLMAVWAVFDDRPLAHACSATAFVAFIALANARFGLRERMLLTLALLATAAAVWKFRGGALQPVIDDLSRAAYLSAFIMLVTTLRQGAFGSDSVLTIGRYLTGQPPGRRYVALHVGSHFIGVLLNFGAVTLLGPLIRRGVDARRDDGPPELSEIRLRRQICGLSRGFAWFNLWAPTAVAQAVVLNLVPGANAGIIAMSGMAIAILLLCAGWGEDRLTGYRARLRLVEAGFALQPAARLPFPWTSLLRFMAVGGGLLGGAWLIARATDIPLVSAIMIAAVPITIAWMSEQSLSHGAGPALAGRLRALFGTVLPGSSPEAATLGLAGYIGILTATLVEHDWLAARMAPIDPHPNIVYLAVSAVVPLASCIGLPPMMTVTFLGGLLVSLPELALNPSVLGLALLVGWALNLTGSPFGATSLMLTRVVGIPGTTHAWRWNGVFTLISWCVAALVMVTVAALS